MRSVLIFFQANHPWLSSSLRTPFKRNTARQLKIVRCIQYILTLTLADVVTNLKLPGGQEFQVHLYDTMGVVCFGTSTK